MTSEPEEIRADIESTRQELGNDVDALAEKVRPSSIAHRQTEKVKTAVSRAKDRVMGTAEDATHAVGDTVGDLPRKAADTTRGNPIAVGLIAFGVGWLASSLIPASRKERELADTAKEKAGPAIDRVKEAAGDMVDDLKQPAKDAAESVKGSVQDAASNIKGGQSQPETTQPMTPSMSSDTEYR